MLPVYDEKTVGFGAEDKAADYKAMADTIRETLKQSFRPEFLNRIDEVVIFHSLQKKELHQIVKLMAKTVIKRISDQGIPVKITPAAIDVIADAGFDPEYGARPIRRALQTKIEDRLSEALLSGEIKPGSQVTLGATRGNITVNVKEADAPKSEKNQPVGSK